jgi:hypothetical protein
MEPDMGCFRAQSLSHFAMMARTEHTEQGFGSSTNASSSAQSVFGDEPTSRKAHGMLIRA